MTEFVFQEIVKKTALELRTEAMKARQLAMLNKQKEQIDKRITELQN